jgi:Lon protease-like protein
MKLPLFPLGAVLFPGARMALRVFEPRYVDLVRDSLRQNAPFGIVRIREGREVVLPGADPMPRLMPIGAFARIVDWDAMPNGMLGIVVEGEGRFRLLGAEQQPNFLIVGDVEPLPAEAALPLPERAQSLLPLMQQLLEHPAIRRLQMQPQVDDGGLLANQLAQLLPIPETEKFTLLAETDPLVRLDRLLQKLEEIDGA